MAAKKVTREICVREGKDGSLVLPDGAIRTAGQIISRGTESSMLEQVVTQILLEQKIQEIEDLIKPMKERISLTKKDEILKSLIEKGFLKAGEDPTIKITRSNGEVLDVTLSAKTDLGFTVDKTLEDLIDSLPDFMTRTPKKTVETKAVLEKLYTSGKIPGIYAPYFSTHPVEVTKVSSKKSKAAA